MDAAGGDAPSPAEVREPVDGQPARERAYRFVRDGILSGRLSGGAFPEEVQLSLAIGVSRTPVREALNRLQAERLIELIPRRGARVREVTLRELVEVYEARRAIEIHVARSLCVARVGAPQEMARLLDAMYEIPPNDLVRHVELDVAFHQAMVAALTSITTEPRRLGPILEEHSVLLRALNAFDGDAAAALLARHLQPVFEVLSRMPGYAALT